MKVIRYSDNRTLQGMGFVIRRNQIHSGHGMQAKETDDMHDYTWSIGAGW